MLLTVIAASLARGAQPPVRLPSLRGEDSGFVSREPTARPPSSSFAMGEPQGGPSPAATSRGTAAARLHARGTLIFLIDDVGYNLDELAPFLALPAPLTLSVLPQLPESRRAYERIVAAGKLAILHQPMEADAKIDPGPGTISVGMQRPEVEQILSTDLSELPGATWLNNHEGSRVTSDPRMMGMILSYVKEHHLHFLDSRTTASSAAKAVARSLGMPYYERNAPFLDDSLNRGSIESEIANGERTAEEQGYAVMIGHVWDHDLPGILATEYPKLLASGFRFATLDALENLVKQP